MADNVAITAGAGTTIATDEVAVNGGSAAHAQYMKLVDGTANGTDGLPGTAARGLTVDPRFFTARITATSAGLTTATTSYVLDDQLGTILSWASAVRASGGTGTITGATLLDKAAVVQAVDLYLFNQSVTLAADNAQADFSDADMDSCMGVIAFPPPTKAKTGTTPSNTIATISGLGMPFECSGSTTLYGALVTRSGHGFFAAAGDLKVSLFIQKD